MNRLSGDLHPGDWRHHHTLVPPHGRGDLIPEKIPDYYEETITPGGELLAVITGLVTGDQRESEMEAGG
jgi:hypothetical protein